MNGGEQKMSANRRSYEYWHFPLGMSLLLPRFFAFSLSTHALPTCHHTSNQHPPAPPPQPTHPPTHQTLPGG